MNAQELRIGNQIYYNQVNLDTGEREQVVVTVDANMIKAMTMHDAELYSPIPLTPEILEQCTVNDFVSKLNFKDSETPFYTLYITDSAYIVFGTKDLKLSLHVTFLGNVPVNLSHIKTLHQLQNFIYFTFNTELQWNRNK